ncbi:MAG: hypothetical protein ACTHK6_10925 [Solirubrobacterales bacterium]
MDPDRVAPRELLRHAIDGIQGSIHANDSKSAAGLIVQGLLATAVVTLIGHLGSLYGEATEFVQILIKATLILTLVAALFSIGFLIWAVTPYEPDDEFATRNKRGDVYFPPMETLKEEREAGHGTEFEQLRPKFYALHSDAALDDEYLSELLMVADIRWTEARRAKWGFGCLAIEVVLVILYLGTIGAVAGHMLGAAEASGAPSLRWEVVQGPRRQAFSPVGQFRLSPPHAQVRLRIEDPNGVRSLKLIRRVKYRCQPHGKAVRRRSGKPSAQSARLFGAEKAVMLDRVALSRLRCPGGRKARGAVWLFKARELPESGAPTTGLLRLRARRGSG